jgi:hypothetical protein
MIKLNDNSKNSLEIDIMSKNENPTKLGYLKLYIYCKRENLQQNFDIYG